MPKMKTHAGTKKRFKVTGSGNVVVQVTNILHQEKHKNKQDN